MNWFKSFVWFLNERERKQKQQKLEEVFAGRESLDDRQLWDRYFQQHGVAAETVAKVRHILSETLLADLSCIRDTDDFSRELGFFWDFDSMADVEIVEALERDFGITITDDEAAAMKTLRDIILGVHTKILKS